MRDYEELVRVLREQAEKYNGLLGAAVATNVMKQAADAIEELLQENDALGRSLCECDDLLKKLERHKWISVKERLPEIGKRVLILYELRDDEENISVGWLEDGGFVSWDDSLWTMRDVTNWMPFPEPPKEANNG